MGEIERGKMVPEFEKAAFRLKEGQVSGLVETPYGLHIIKVDKIIPGETLPLAKVEAEIKNRLMDQKMKVKYQEYLSQLKKGAFIEDKLSFLIPSAPKTADHPQTRKVKKSSRHRHEELADVPSPKKKTDSGRRMDPGQPFSRFQTFEEELKHYRQLRNNNKISEREYQSKKRELLNRF